MFTPEQEVLLKILQVKNGREYNYHKASEEAIELGLALTQKLLKPKKVDEQEIIDELGDNYIRMEILKLEHPEWEERIKARIELKLSKYKEYKDSETYKQI